MKTIQKRWQQILSVMLLSLALAACGGGVRADEPSVPEPQESIAAEGTTVHGVATEFAFALDRSDVDAGTVTFIITNNGSAPHDFAIEGEGVQEQTEMIQPGQSASLTVDLAPGTYTYICTIPGHAMLGMEGAFTVN